jgi:hypothetical protein
MQCVPPVHSAEAGGYSLALSLEHFLILIYYASLYTIIPNLFKDRLVSWEGDQKVVKRSGRDESIRVVIHLCMEAMLAISLYNYLYLKLAKHYVFLLIIYVFSSTKSENKNVEQVLPGGWGKGGGLNNVYICE